MKIPTKQLLALAVVSLAFGCSKNGDQVCSPVNSWHMPVFSCAAPALEIEEPAPEPLVAKPKRIRIDRDRIEILGKVQFATGSAQILEESYPLLDEVAETLADNQDIRRVEVQGHTDSTGSASFNRKLSADRAASVKEYLIGQGVDTGRLTSAGYGPDQPIADNDTEDGRYQNRRVEFKIVERDDPRPIGETRRK